MSFIHRFIQRYQSGELYGVPLPSMIRAAPDVNFSQGLQIQRSWHYQQLPGKLTPKLRSFVVKTQVLFALLAKLFSQLLYKKGEPQGPGSLSCSIDSMCPAASGPCTVFPRISVGQGTVHVLLVSTWALYMTFEDSMGACRRGSHPVWIMGASQRQWGLQ